MISKVSPLRSARDSLTNGAAAIGRRKRNFYQAAPLRKK
jgi:hypothetical protein